MPSVMQRVGTPNARHNLDNKYREHLENVNPELSKYNEIVRHVPVEDIYDEHLQQAFIDFNEKQKRRDRRLDVKYECETFLDYQRALDKQARESKNSIDQKGRPPIREIVWQFGNPEQGYGSKGQTEESREQIKGMLLEVQAEAERRYPQIAWGDLIFHADEESLDAEDKECGSLHLHSSFVPLCYNNKQGPEVQVAFERCLREMGFSTFQAWKHDLDNIMETVLEKHGLERTMMNNTNEHKDSKEFHKQQKLIKETKELEAKTKTALEESKIAVKNAASLETKISSLEGEKASLESHLDVLKRESDKASAILQSTNNFIERDIPLIEKYKQQYAETKEAFEKLDSELPVLKKQISEQRAELEIVNEAIKRKIEDANGKFTGATIEEKMKMIKAEQEKERRYARLEREYGLFQDFLEHFPQIKELWNRFVEAVKEHQEKQKSKNKVHEKEL